VLITAAFAGAAPAPDSPLPVRYLEGVTHGFLALATPDSTLLSYGDQLQVMKGLDTVEARMLFKFKDGSLLDETVTYSERRVFTMLTYRLTQQGPAFKQDLDVRMDRSTGTYRVATKDHKDGKEKVREGTLDLPPDVYNGMVMLVAKNLEKGASATIHFVAFTPEPRIIQLEYTPIGSAKVAPPELPGTMIKYRVKPILGVLLKVMSAVLGRTPPDNYAWIIHETVPAFVRFEGPLSMDGPVWRIETTAPRWPAK
jgi:hypothetical protein